MLSIFLLDFRRKHSRRFAGGQGCVEETVVSVSTKHWAGVQDHEALLQESLPWERVLSRVWLRRCPYT